MNLIALYWAMLLLEAEPGPVSFADNSFTLVPLRAEDLPPERAVQMALDFLRAVGLSVQEPPGLMELGQWRSYGWRIPRMWRLGWGPPHWPRTIEITFNALSGELILYNNEDAEYYTCRACRRGDPPQIGSQRALELAQYYLKASGGVSVPVVFKGLYRSVDGYSSVDQVPREIWEWVAGWTRVTQGVPWVLEHASVSVCPYTGRLLGIDKMYWSADPTNRVFVDAATAVRLATHHLRERGFSNPGPALYAQLVVVHPDNTAGTLPQFAWEVCPEARLAWEVAFPYVKPGGRETVARFYVDAENGLVIGGGLPGGPLWFRQRSGRPRGASGGEVLGRARRDLSRLREVEIQRWTLEGARSKPRLIASLRLSAREVAWRGLLAAVRRGRSEGTATGGAPSWRFVFHRADGTFFRGAYCPADGRLQLEDYPEPGSLVFLWPERAFERGLIELPYPPLPDSSPSSTGVARCGVRQGNRTLGYEILLNSVGLTQLTAGSRADEPDKSLSEKWHGGRFMTLTLPALPPGPRPLQPRRWRRCLPPNGTR